MMPSDGNSGEKPVVLCVDDESPVLSALARLLRNEPVELITTTRPEEALSLIEQRDIDVLIADQRMPGVTGTELLKAARKISPDTVRVILTAYANVDWITQAINAGGIQALVHKPWDDDDFKRLIRETVRLRGESERFSTEPQPCTDLARHPGSVQGQPSSREAEELVLRIDCARKNSGEVLEKVGQMLHHSAATHTRPVLIFENLERVEGSLARLLKSVLRDSCSTRAGAWMLDSSGLSATFLDALPPELKEIRGAFSRRPARVLMVGADAETLDMLRSVVASAGHACKVVSSADEAAACAMREKFDAVLINLPEADAARFEEQVSHGGAKTLVIGVNAFIISTNGATYARFSIQRRVWTPILTTELLALIDGARP